MSAHMSADGDPIDDLTSVTMTGAASMARVAEILIRQAQDAKARMAAGSRENAADGLRRIEAQGAVAEAFYQRAATVSWLTNADPKEIAAAVRGVHEWAEVEPERFESHAVRMRSTFQTVFGVDLREVAQDRENRAGLEQLVEATVSHVDQVQAATGDLRYDSPGRRAVESERLKETGVPVQAVTAKMTADLQNGTDPRLSATTGGQSSGGVKQAPRTQRQRVQERRRAR